MSLSGLYYPRPVDLEEMNLPELLPSALAIAAASYLLLRFSWNASEIRSVEGLSSDDYTNFIWSDFQQVKLVAESFVLLFPLDQFGMVVLHE